MEAYPSVAMELRVKKGREWRLYFGCLRSELTNPELPSQCEEKNGVDAKYWFCNDESKTVEHFGLVCKILTLKEYNSKHDKVGQ